MYIVTGVLITVALSLILSLLMGLGMWSLIVTIPYGWFAGTQAVAYEYNYGWRLFS